MTTARRRRTQHVRVYRPGKGYLTLTIKHDAVIPVPLSNILREFNYRAQRGTDRLTPRQLRRIRHHERRES